MQKEPSTTPRVRVTTRHSEPRTLDIHVSQGPTPQQLAKDAADRYFAALASRIPFDSAPGDVDLISAVNDIHDAIMRERPMTEGYREQAAMDAGYLLGIEIGRRMGGAR